jgi:hypothetical protein
MFVTEVWYLQYYYESYRQDSTQTTSTQTVARPRMQAAKQSHKREKEANTQNLTPHNRSRKGRLIFGIVRQTSRKKKFVFTQACCSLIPSARRRRGYPYPAMVLVFRYRLVTFVKRTFFILLVRGC